jgi:hypothetical protein
MSQKFQPGQVSILTAINSKLMLIYTIVDFHKNSGDTGDLETLDTMMDGQTHRAQLSAIIRESGGQAYADSSTMKDNFIQVTERSTPSRGRGGSFSGRGGHIPSAAVHM